MISREKARGLREAGLAWHPRPGDAFSMLGAEFADEVFTVSEMTIESHEFDTGTILGFNGTTEWALDSVAIEDALWMPREDQLRELLGGTFRSLRADGDGFVVSTGLVGRESEYRADAAADAYADALLALITAAVA
ncbi:pilus assembly protein CpaE [Microbacterium sp. STN6]|uniref:pilus assembly protein CpaE n=1 Tax=Microbacterium sp. STN6 TaxID=2995588 RepID=UPI00226100E3|nr:pilus assembly protein CpaE [Microbacterium sp. STN6]MCX7521252.1 pilus assembly protein CpaE [Microbacterium sp. STN6]